MGVGVCIGSGVVNSELPNFYFTTNQILQVEWHINRFDREGAMTCHCILYIQHTNNIYTKYS